MKIQKKQRWSESMCKQTRCDDGEEQKGNVTRSDQKKKHGQNCVNGRKRGERDLWELLPRDCVWHGFNISLDH